MSTAVVVAIIMGGTAFAGTVIAGWYTYRGARSNAEATRELDAQKLSVATWTAQVEAWRADVVALRQQRAEDRREHEEQIAELKAEIDWLRGDRTDQIRRDRARGVWEQAMVDWVSEWLPRARALGLVVPNPPEAPALHPLFAPENPGGHP